MMDETQQALHEAHADELRTRAEVEAFAHRFHAKLLQAMKSGSTNVVDMIGAAMEAAGVGGSRPSQSDYCMKCERPKNSFAHAECMGRSDVKDSHEKIADPPAHVLFLEERGRWVKAMDAAFAQSLNAMLCPDASQRTELPLEEALREVHRCLSGIPSGSAIALIESKARDAANQHTAAILATMLGMKSPPTDGWDLSKALSQTKEALDASTKLRDAALEEAAQECVNNLHKFVSHYHWPDRIRALKSKPAPDTRPKQEDHCPECEKPKTAHGMSCPQDVRPRPHSNGCALDADHKGACFGPSLLEMERQEAKMYQSPEPIHDFGWALAQMRAGKKIRRRVYSPGQWYAVDDGELYACNGTSSQRRDRDGFGAASILATDWELAP